MAQNRKSIIDEALIEAQQIDEAFKANAKEILSHTMGTEIEEMVKESLKDSRLNEENEDDENEATDLMDDEMDMDDEMEMEDEVSDEETEETDDMDTDMEMGMDMNNDMEMDTDEEMEMDTDEESEEMEMDTDMDDEMDLAINTIDLTTEPLENVIKVFKKMGPEDEIEVVQNGSQLDIKDKKSGAEYRVELPSNSEMEGEEEMEDETEMEMEDEDSLDEGVIYEIYMDDEDEMEDETIEEEEDMEYEEDVELEEKRQPRTYKTSGMVPNRRTGSRYEDRTKLNYESKTPNFSKLLKENRELKNTVTNVESENKELKENYGKMVNALKDFRQKLQEVAVFNSNLTYAVRLFTEHSTTKEEKVDIIKRFDDAKSIKESKMIYKNIVKEVSKTKAPIKETLDEKINTPKTSGSVQITESKAYVNPELETMRKLWNFNYDYNNK